MFNGCLFRKQFFDNFLSLQALVISSSRQYLRAFPPKFGNRASPLKSHYETGSKRYPPYFLS